MLTKIREKYNYFVQFYYKENKKKNGAADARCRQYGVCSAVNFYVTADQFEPQHVNNSSSIKARSSQRVTDYPPPIQTARQVTNVLAEIRPGVLQM